MRRYSFVFVLLCLVLRPAWGDGTKDGCPRDTVEVNREIIRGPDGDTVRIHCRRLAEISDRELTRLPPAAFSRLSPEGKALLDRRLEAAFDALDSTRIDSELEAASDLPVHRRIPFFPATAALAAWAAGAWALAYKRRRAIGGALLATGLAILVVVTIKAPPAPVVTAMTRLGAARLLWPSAAATASGQLLRLSEHAEERLPEAFGEGPQALNSLREVVQRPPVQFFHGGVWKTGYYDSTAKVFVATYNGIITTIIDKVKPQYVSNLLSKKP